MFKLKVYFNDLCMLTMNYNTYFATKKKNQELNFILAELTHQIASNKVLYKSTFF